MSNEKKADYRTLQMKFYKDNAQDMEIYKTLEDMRARTKIAKTGIVKGLLYKILIEEKSKKEYNIINILKLHSESFGCQIDISGSGNKKNKYFQFQIKFYDYNDADMLIYKAIKSLNMVGITQTTFIKNVLYKNLVRDLAVRNEVTLYHEEISTETFGDSDIDDIISSFTN